MRPMYRFLYQKPSFLCSQLIKRKDTFPYLVFDSLSLISSLRNARRFVFLRILFLKTNSRNLSQNIADTELVQALNYFKTRFLYQLTYHFTPYTPKLLSTPQLPFHANVKYRISSRRVEVMPTQFTTPAHHNFDNDTVSLRIIHHFLVTKPFKKTSSRHFLAVTSSNQLAQAFQ